MSAVKDLDELSHVAALNESLKGSTAVDIHAVYARLLAQGGVCPGKISESEFQTKSGVNEHDPSRDAFSVLSYDAVTRVLTDSDTFSVECYVESLGRVMGENVLTLDGDKHRRQRSLLNPIFLGPAKLALWLETIIEPAIAEQIEKLKSIGTKADLVNDLCLIFPFTVLIRLLGIPAEAMSRFHRLAIEILGGGGIDTMFSASAALGVEIRNLIAVRREAPTDDLISALIAAKSNDDRFSEEEIVSFLKLLFPAGAETTSRASANLLVALLTHPDQLEAVRADRSLIPAAIEESLRWESPVSEGSRLAKKEVELNGIHIPKGSVVYFYEGCANRDSAMYEDPARFNIFRKVTRKNLAFGHMRHVCMGQGLSKLEITTMLNMLLDRLPNFRLDPDLPQPKIDGVNFRSPSHIWVRID